MTKTVFTNTKHEDLFRMGGAELRALAAGNGRLARTKAARAEVARRKANLQALKASS